MVGRFREAGSAGINDIKYVIRQEPPKLQKSGEDELPVQTTAIIDLVQYVDKEILSICGYADRLYSRRNALVHGAGGASFLENDRIQIKKSFEVAAGAQTMIKVGSITNAASFYKSVCEMLTEHA